MRPRGMKSLIAIVVIGLCASFAHSAAAALPTLAVPQIFAPGTISVAANDGAPTFSPDGNTLLFTRSAANWGIILESERDGGRWSKPRIAAFSGRWSDWAPEFSPDGRYLVFVSIRADHHANLWRVDRTPVGWGKPLRLPVAVNRGPSIWKSSIVADGSIYFVSIDAKGNKRLYCSRYAAGAYQRARPLSFSDGAHGDVDPEVAPDESFMVFASSGRVTGDTQDHLFIVFHVTGAWGTPMPIRYAGDNSNGRSTDNEPHLSPDRRTLYFSSDRTVPAHFPRTRQQAQHDLEQVAAWGNVGNNSVWSVPLGPLLEKHLPRAGGG
jgi:Tol biopolymer transport system component